MYLELTQDGSRVMVNMNAVAFIEPSAIGALVYVGRRILHVDEDYEKIRNILLKCQGVIVSPVKLTK